MIEGYVLKEVGIQSPSLNAKLTMQPAAQHTDRQTAHLWGKSPAFVRLFLFDFFDSRGHDVMTR